MHLRQARLLCLLCAAAVLGPGPSWVEAWRKQRLYEQLTGTRIGLADALAYGAEREAMERFLEQ